MLNERIKQQRILHGLNQVELAKKLGVSKQSVSNWENDNIQPSIEMLIKISHFFSVSTDYLLGEDNRKYLEVSNLTKRELRHIQYIIDDMVNAKKSSHGLSKKGKNKNQPQI
jgi:transcriptional regulator with XRE-family HTH domain